MKNRYLSAYNSEKIPFSQALFEAPDTCLYPVYFWVWNARITKEGIIQQIDDMYRADIRAFSIIPEPSDFRPEKMVTELDPPYLSPAFMELIKFSVDYAAQKGMHVWLYDEGGWPSGGAGGLVCRNYPHLARKNLAERQVALSVGSIYTMPEDCVAAYCGAKRIFNGFTPEQDIQITEYHYCYLSDYFTDIGEKETTERFLAITHEQYKAYAGEHFGTVMALSFTDEPKNPRPNFIFGFEDLFAEKYGYDILDHIQLLFKKRDQACSDEEIKILLDYYRLCAEVKRNHFLKPYRQWCQQNGLLFAGHWAADNFPGLRAAHGDNGIVDDLCAMDIPGIDTIWRQIMNGGKARDTEAPFFPRFASSAAHMNGTNLALTESFGVYGCGLTYDEMRYIANYQLVRGINLHSYMLVTYGRERFLSYVERPSFTPEIPGYENLSAFNHYVARASYVCTMGKPVIDTALYMPLFDFYADKNTYLEALQSFVALGVKLENSGIEFDVVDDYCLERAVFDPDGICIGKAKYKHIYIPENRYMDSELREKLVPYMTEARPLLESKAGFAMLRTATRKLSGSEYVYFLFNESDEELQTELTLSLGGDCGYELDMTSGVLYRCPVTAAPDGKKKLAVTLSAGEAKAYLFTDRVFETTEDLRAQFYENARNLDKFEVSVKTRTVLDQKGFYKTESAPDFREAELGAWKTYFGEEFSGDVVYRTTVHFEKAPAHALLELGTVEYSAAVFVNGQYAGTAITTPKTVCIGDGILKEGENTVEILVSNTAANQYALTDADTYFLPKEVGCYHQRAKDYERETAKGGLYGPVRLRY